MTVMRAHTRRWCSDVLDLFAPPRCVACGDPFPTFPAGETPALCQLCALGVGPAVDPPVDVCVPYAHEGPLARAIHRAKYGADPACARHLGALLKGPFAERHERFDAVVPVPLHPRRLVARGFNQAYELARALRLPVITHGVVRRRDTPTQVGLDRAERWTNVHGAFEARTTGVLRDRCVLVLDDVVTTGATLAEVAAVVHAMGARTVVRMALARAPLESPAKGRKGA